MDTDGRFIRVDPCASVVLGTNNTHPTAFQVREAGVFRLGPKTGRALSQRTTRRNTFVRSVVRICTL